MPVRDNPLSLRGLAARDPAGGARTADGRDGAARALRRDSRGPRRLRHGVRAAAARGRAADRCAHGGARSLVSGFPLRSRLERPPGREHASWRGRRNRARPHRNHARRGRQRSERGIERERLCRARRVRAGRRAARVRRARVLAGATLRAWGAAPLNDPISVARDEFARRRRQLMRLMGRDCIAILPAAPVRHRNNDVEYAYRQDSDFHYLTGFDEPESVAVLVPGREQAEYILFVRERDPTRETWDGRRAGPAGAARDYGADDAFPVTDIDEILPGLLENRTSVFYTMGAYADFDQRVVGWVNGLRTQARNGRHPPQEFVALDHVLHDMRLYKSRHELALLRASARIAAQAHQRAMRFCRPGATEYQVMAELLHEFRRHNADTAYHPIVGGGRNSCILHYRENNQPLADGDLLLVDAGCELECYASDIARTFPVNGRFTPEQRAVYEVVLEANRAAIERVRPGNHWNEPHQAAVRVITQGLVKLGLLKGRVAALIRSGAYQRFFIHRTGHWLGLDVHDVGDYKVGDQWRVLEPGMVMTIEPGIYLPAGARGVPKRFRNIGIRIEDDVVVTRRAAEVLTARAPKDADQIEALMGRG